ncbi:YigZ family protein [Gottfriedia solisilvae]|uniref:YigZ family protein n=1 Tax=Gottfriedia solisilvae TaxID=1516104 RepID=A0A8J3ATI4_9BACI|nr:YigZ family protein [Gottfriedia solisilvae]GGI16547.1 YigZ family protein [Gottfriedia solisilvae]
MLPNYFTVRGFGSHEIEIEKSRFICYINEVKSEQDAQQFILEIKKKHSDANHNCSAYLIGEKDEIQKASDDGEPSGTAGVPMLEVLKKRGLKDTVVVVTRYFGGKKLGAGGLIRAYGQSVSEGLNEVGIVERTLVKVINVRVSYKLLGKVEHALRNSNYHLEKVNHLEEVEFELWIKINEVNTFTEWMVELTNGSCDISESIVKYM